MLPTVHDSNDSLFPSFSVKHEIRVENTLGASLYHNLSLEVARASPSIIVREEYPLERAFHFRRRSQHECQT